MIELIYLLLIAFAIYCVVSRNLRQIIIGTGAFSLLASFLYLLFHAPDVAIAEAVIGSALATILFIVALKKYRIFLPEDVREELQQGSDANQRLVRMLSDYCEAHELNFHVAHTESETDTTRKSSDVIVCIASDGARVYASCSRRNFTALRDELAPHMPDVSFILRRDSVPLSPKRITLLALSVLCALYVLLLSRATSTSESFSLFEKVMRLYQEDMQINPVAAVYLNYRVFDTLFEALLLLLGVIGIYHFSRHEEGRTYE